MWEQNVMNLLLGVSKALETLSIRKERVDRQVEKCRLIYGGRHSLKRRREELSSEDEIPCKIRKLNECP